MYFTDVACQSNPCLNSGTCFSTLTGYRCLCVMGYTGSNCETGKLLLDSLDVIIFCCNPVLLLHPSLLFILALLPAFVILLHFLIFRSFSVSFSSASIR